MSNSSKPDAEDTSYAVGPFGEISLSYGPHRFDLGAPQLRRNRLSCKGMADWFAHARSIALSVLFFVLLGLVLWIFVDGLWHEEVIIDPIYAPEEFRKRGYTDQILASRLRDAVYQVESAGSNFFDLAKVDKRPQSTLVAPEKEHLEITLPEIGLSARSVLRHLKTALNVGITRISGEIVCNAPACDLDSVQFRLRMQGTQRATFELRRKEGDSGDGLFINAAVEILKILNPIYVLEYAYEKNNPELVSEVAESMIHSAHKDKMWAMNALGVLHSDAGRYDEAEKYFEMAMKENSAVSVLYVNLGMSQWAAGRADKARASIDNALELDQASKVAHTVLGYMLLESSPEEALDSFHRAVNANPRDADARTGKGIALGRLDKLEPAVEAYREALRLNPSHALAHYGLGNVLLRLGRLDEAAYSYGEAIKLDPDAGTLLRESGQLAEALPGVLVTARLLSSRRSWLYDLAQLSENAGERETALAAAHGYLEVAPEGDRAGEAAEMIARLSASAASPASIGADVDGMPAANEPELIE